MSVEEVANRDDVTLEVRGDSRDGAMAFTARSEWSGPGWLPADPHHTYSECKCRPERRYRRDQRWLRRSRSQCRSQPGSSCRGTCSVVWQGVTEITGKLELPVVSEIKRGTATGRSAGAAEREQRRPWVYRWWR